MRRLNIDDKTRQGLLAILDALDPKIDELFTDKGQRDYPELLRAAFASHDQTWLADQFALEGRLHQGSFKTERELKSKARALAADVFDKYLLLVAFDQMLEKGEISPFAVKRTDPFTFDPTTNKNKHHFLETLNPAEPYRMWVGHWCDALLACERMGGDPRALSVKPPANEQEVTGVEDELGHRLPTSLRQTFLDFSAGFEFTWFLPKALERPIGAISSGGFGEIGLRWLLRLEETRRGWTDHVFCKPQNSYDSVWYNKLAAFDVANGDMIAIDLDSADGPVIYLSHAGNEAIHGRVLGANFADFMGRWSELGCVGPEGWQLQPFIEDASGGINPQGTNAGLWRTWFALE